MENKNNISDKKIGQKIKQIRELRKITREVMASELGMSLPGYSRIERNEVDVSVERANQIAQVLGISLSELINFDEKYIFNNYATNQNAFVINSQVTAENIKMYENIIEILKNQLAEKDRTIQTLLNKISKNH